MKLSRPESLELTDPAAIALLLEPKKVRWLEPFVAKPCSLNEAAETLGSSLGSYSYWLNKFLDYGLLEAAFEKPRLGSPIKHYWTVAETFSFDLGQSAFEERVKLYQQSFLKLLEDALPGQADDEAQACLTFTISYDPAKRQHYGVPGEIDLTTGLVLKLPDPGCFVPQNKPS